MKSAFTHTTRTRRFDILLAVGLTLIGWLQVFLGSVASNFMTHVDVNGLDIVTGFHARSPWVTILLTAICFLPLIWRRNYPLLILAVVTVGQCAAALWTHDPLLTFIGPLVALYTAGTLVSTKRLVAATVIVCLALVGVNHFAPMVRPIAVSVRTGSEDQGNGVFVDPQSDTRSDTDDNALEYFGIDDSNLILRDRSGQVLPQGGGASGLALVFMNLSRGRTVISMLQIVLSAVAFAALGRMTRLHREYIAEAHRRFEEEARAARAEAERRAEEERLAIARELHDITAHSLAAIAVQAGAAEATILADPDAATAAVATIRTTAQKSLDELRQVVGALRAVETGPFAASADAVNGAKPQGTAPLTPQAGLSDLDELLATFRRSNLDVQTRIDPAVLPFDNLPVASGQAAFRIIQEALTNVLRHAQAPATATVTICPAATAGQFYLEIRDNGQRDDNAGPAVTVADGHGIAGMRERALALGGAFQAGPDPQAGGFVVRASLPARPVHPQSPAHPTTPTDGAAQ
ncbi:MAG: histidine kinase [Actinomycetes bacterium]|jgi:signal transduction histidine kinase|nr:histidine kinase [Actinomycetes bacterium]